MTTHNTNADADMTFHDCCRAILADNEARSLQWALAYAEAGLFLEGEPARVQALYILNNVTHWRHPKARIVRMSLKVHGKVKKS